MYNNVLGPYNPRLPYPFRADIIVYVERATQFSLPTLCFPAEFPPLLFSIPNSYDSGWITKVLLLIANVILYVIYSNFLLYHIRLDHHHPSRGQRYIIVV